MTKKELEALYEKHDKEAKKLRSKYENCKEEMCTTALTIADEFVDGWEPGKSTTQKYKARRTAYEQARKEYYAALGKRREVFLLLTEKAAEDEERA